MAKTIHSPQMLKKVISYIFLEPATTKYPFVKPKVDDGFRGQPIFDINVCISCGLCSKECPSKAIVMVEVNGKKYPQFSLDKCIFCYHCADSCPKKAIKNSTFFELATTDKSSLTMKPQLTV